MRPAKRPRSTVILLYATTAGIAAASPIAVANSASAIPGATTARLVLLAAAMPAKLRMIPHTVPNRPMNGAAEPSVARNGRRASRRRNSAFSTSRIARSIRSRRSPAVSGAGHAAAVLSAQPADSTRAGRVAGLGLARCGHQFGRRMRGSGPRLMALRRPADRREPPQLVDDHRPAPHRGGEQQQQHALDDDVGMQEQADD